jgi:hypothetical protein
VKIGQPSLIYRFVSLILFLSLLSGCAASEKLYYIAPSLLPGTERPMKTAGFWISRHPCPDSLILTADEIQNLNETMVSDLEVTKDIIHMPSPFPGNTLRECIEEDLGRYREQTFFLRDGRKASAAFFNKIKHTMNSKDIAGEIFLRYGLIVHYASQRILPTEEALYAEPMDIDFDELRNNALDVGTPVVILHESRNGDWLYVFDRMHRGWIEKDKIAFCSLADVETFVGSPDFVVVTASKGDIYRHPSLMEWHDYARMGTRFLHKGTDGSGTVRIIIPVRRIDGNVSFESAYMRASEVHEGYLPYTPRMIIQQAFAMINEPYGWGGMYGEQDCSRFIKEIFDTVGLYLPRNSSKQALVGVLLGEYPAGTTDAVKREALAREAVAGITLMGLRGHIMLFLGFVNDKPYAIHETWGYREKQWYGDRIRVINRVAVTDLTLGQGSKKGSYLERMYAIRMLSLKK